MLKLSPLVVAVTFVLVASACSGASDQVTVEAPQPRGDVDGNEGDDVLAYPETPRGDVVETLHGTQVPDPYRWLESPDKPEVQKWMDDQDALTREYLKSVEARDQFRDRLRELYYVDSISAPQRRGEYFFYRRRHADKEKAVYYWRRGEDGEENVLLDPNAMGDGENVSIGRVSSSWDGEKVAYTIRENNADESTLYVMDTDTGKVSDIDVIVGAKYAYPSWTPDSKGFYYTWLPTDEKIPVADRPGYADLRYHKLGTSPDQDVVVREKTGDPKAFVGIQLSRDGRWLFAYVWHGWNATDIYYRDLKQKKTGWKTIVEGIEAQFDVTAYKNHFYIFTNDGAPRGKMYRVAAGPRVEDRKNWKEIVPEDESAVMDANQIIGGHLVLTYQKNAASLLQIRKLDGKLVRDVEFPEIGASYGMTGNEEDDTAYYSFQSFKSPLKIFKTSIKSGQTSQWAAVEVPVDTEPYEAKQVWYESKDGTKVSMFIVHRKDMPMDGSTPLLLYGYGGFNVSMRPWFRSSIYPWLEAGGAYAVPNLRGGGEYGEDWHKAGMLGNKQNVFDDFIAAAEYLIDNKYTSSDKLAIRGGSNGGLLVGAAMVQRPELFRAVVCAVPLLDMVRYHKFGSGKTWIPEYGSADNEEDFGWLFAYSPYHHVQDNVEYPAMLMLSADNDDRVDPMHARKFTAAIQHADTGGRPVLLRIERNSGHGGADLVKQAVEEGADVYAFLARELGLEPKATPAADP